ncbi:hypothetical protein IEQ34_012367 [Dendrobium chrysotoxum]|uniref:U6 snRNA-associated Sm-like protein LSm8 n=1 Tax=Dendrobium chrysotoxum TaxID=161865 RepID=A0AAV7GV66_DENCH|nr:hypothetical protein IEQ34_012367 [Dendrobium chrysotoxum]
MSTGPGLESLVDQTISIITNDGRNIVGILKGFDQATNIILDESHERVYSTKKIVTYDKFRVGIRMGVLGQQASLLGQLLEAFPVEEIPKITAEIPGCRVGIRKF